MRKTMLYLFAAMLAFSVVIPASASPSPQKPGKWKVTMQMEMPGMPIKMPPMSFEVCLTEEDLKDPQKAVPNDPKSDCKVGDYAIDGNTVTWTVDCPKQKMKGEGEITFTNESYTGKMDMQIGEQEMSTKYSGKWIGACTK